MRKEVSAHSISGAILLDDIEPSGHLAGQLSTDEFLRTIRHEQADAVLVSAPALEIPSLSQRISESGLRMPVGFLVSPAEGISDRVSGAGGVYLLNTGAQPAATLNYRLFKRAFDILFSFTALVAGLPLLLLIALLVKIGSRGPIFFVQDRVGWNGRVFRMYKFRTMRSASAIESDTRWTSPGNARVTPVGRFLRRYSLDELPQFLNVLLGDMSLVGPRPERPFFVSTFRRQIDEYHRRHQLKVGLTGWAQVNGLRGDTCIRTRLMYDLYYLQNWGLIFDLKIVLRTVLCVFTGRNAH
jgi:exopolysaccharide biosynthesis polyprenyl glycosylphosphotransferase